MARILVGVTEITPMIAADLPDVLALEQATYHEPWTEPVFRSELAAPGRVYVVARRESDVVGYGGLMVVGPDAHITTVAVDPKMRSGAVGTRLVLDLVLAGIGHGARNLTLEVRVSNVAAQGLYHKFGMAPVGVRKGYYRDEDALIMWAHDIDGDEYRARLAAIQEALK